MRTTGIVLIVLVAACSPGDSAESTTTAGPTTTASTMPPTTTTTTEPATTTTSVAITTTTVAVSTTTTGLLEGNWADAPLVTTAFGAMGWWDGTGWLEAETEGELPVVGGEDYQAVRMAEIGLTTAGPQTTVCEPLGLIGVELADPEMLGEFPGPYGVAISAGWNLQPFVFEEISDDGTYAGFAAELLAARGLEVAQPQIKQVIRTDIEGDGVDEVLVVAEEVSPGLLMEPGDYSIAFMRKVVDGEVQTAVFDETIAVDEDDRFAGAHSFGAAADLNGDGRMELITNSAFFEGFNVAVWEHVNDDIGPVQVLLTGCGV